MQPTSEGLSGWRLTLSEWWTIHSERRIPVLGAVIASYASRPAISGIAWTVEICRDSRSQCGKLQKLPVMNDPTLLERRSPLGYFPGQPTPRLYDWVVEVLRARHCSRRTEEAYFRLPYHALQRAGGAGR